MSEPRKALLSLQLDFAAHQPAYLQIIRQVQGLAASGRLHPGDRLPTVRELAAQLGVNFNTVARAYRLLDAAGVVSAQQGRGTYVVRSTAAATTRTALLRSLTARYVAEARRHNFSAAQVTAMLARQLKSDLVGKPAGESHG